MAAAVAPNSTHGMINKFTYKRRNPRHSFWILIRILWIMKNTNMCSKLMGARSNQWKSLRTILKSYKLRDNQNLTIMIITRLIRIMRRPYRIRSGGNWARRSRLRCSRQLYCRHTRDRAQYHRWTKLSCSPLAFPVVLSLPRPEETIQWRQATWECNGSLPRQEEDEHKVQYWWASTLD